ncbi:hypothetical protein PRUPE_6G131700 [Prunus persica]|uniref:Uncharacterized protein n=1 Tax=Prunus persica TaxID=3760 RepID=A0A251NPR9_PRUPE|nr:hypothetical protein PRUPE_6G131700 [Prunus persica]
MKSKYAFVFSIQFSRSSASSIRLPILMIRTWRTKFHSLFTHESHKIYTGRDSRINKNKGDSLLYPIWGPKL